jgi:tetratricopeptide (TPR) repeat protein
MSRADDLLEETSKLGEAGDWQGVLQKLESGLAEFRESGTDEDAARILYEIGIVPEETVGYDRRLHAAREAASIFERLGNLSDAAKALWRAAETQRDKADSLDDDDDPEAESVRDAAVADFEKVVALYEQAGEELKSALTHFEIGQIYQVGPQDHGTALDQYEVAEPVIRRLGTAGDIAQCLLYKGIALYELQGGDEDLVALLRESLDLHRQSKDNDGQSLAYQFLVEAAVTFDPEEAHRAAEEGLAFARATKDEFLARAIQDALARMED